MAQTKNMTDALKEILGDGYSEPIENAIKAYVGSNFVARADFNEKTPRSRNFSRARARKQLMWVFHACVESESTLRYPLV